MKKSRKQINKIVLRFFAFVSFISIALCAFSIGGYAVTNVYHFPSTFQTYLNDRLYYVFVSSNNYLNYGYNGSSSLPKTDFNAYLVLFPKYVFIGDGVFRCSDYADSHNNTWTRYNFTDVFNVHLVSSNQGTFLTDTEQYYICARIVPRMTFTSSQLSNSRFGFTCIRLKVEKYTVNDVDVYDYYSISPDGVLPNSGNSTPFDVSAFVSYSGPIQNNSANHGNNLAYMTTLSTTSSMPVSINSFVGNAGVIGGTTSWAPQRNGVAYVTNDTLNSIFTPCFPSYYMSNFDFAFGSDEINTDLLDTSEACCNCDAQFEALRSYLNTNMVTKEEFQALVDMLDDSGNANLNNDYTEISSIIDNTAYNTEQSAVNDSIESLSSKFDIYFSQLDSFQSNLQTVPAEVSQAGTLVSNITGRLPSSIIIALSFCLIVFVVVKVLGR